MESSGWSLKAQQSGVCKVKSEPLVERITIMYVVKYLRVK